MGYRVIASGLVTLALTACAGDGIRPAAMGAAPVATTSTTTTTSPPTTTTAPPTTTTTLPPPAQITVAFTGDLLSHSPVFAQARRYGSDTYDYRPMFRAVRDLIGGADLAICHLETPLSADNSDLSGYPVFAAPREMAAAIADAGWDGCSVASNHAFDRGAIGVRTTLDLLDAAGLGHAGTARSAEESAAPTLYETGGITIGHLSFTYGLNGFVLPADQPWLVDVTDPEAVLAAAARARSAGADIVILSIQWGNEYQTDPSEEQTTLARRFLASPDIDLIVGSHAHVVQPLEAIDGEYVLYGLGNFLSNQSANCCPARTQNGVVALFTIEGTERDGYRVTGVEAVPTRVDRSDYTIVAITESTLAEADEASRAVLQAAYDDTVAILTRRGVDLGI